MQRLELQDRGKFVGPAQLLRDDVGGDLRGQRQRESHKSEDSNKGAPRVNTADQTDDAGNCTPPTWNKRKKPVIPRLA